MEENKVAVEESSENLEEQKVLPYNGFAPGKHKGHGLAYHHAQKKENRRKEKIRRATKRAQRKNKIVAKRQKRQKLAKK